MHGAAWFKMCYEVKFAVSSTKVLNVLWVKLYQDKRNHAPIKNLSPVLTCFLGYK